MTTRPTIEPTDRAASPPAPAAAVDTVSLRGVRLHAITETELVDRVVGELDAGRGGWIITLNLQHLHRCETDPTYRQLVEQADLVVADGMPLVWASRLQRTPLPQRVAGSDLVSSLAEAAAAAHRSIYLLGGNPGAAEGAAAVLRERCPELRIAGIEVPEFGFERDVARIDALEQALRAARPDIVYVALGSPKQERLIESMRGVCPSAWWVGVGISFSFLTGEVHRAPPIVRRLGLEWVHRLAQEPRRLFRRYVVEGIPFGLKLLAGAWMGRIGTKARRHEATK